MLLLLPFDSHNHIHLGSTNVNPLLFFEDYNGHQPQQQQQFLLPSNSAVTKVTEQQHDDCHNNDDTNNELFVRQESQLVQIEQINASLTTPTSSLCLSIDMVCSGMAIMSTNINDFRIVKDLAHNLVMNHNNKNNGNHNNNPFHVIPCFGIHPWWLHELINDHEQWDVYSNSDSNNSNNNYGNDQIALPTSTKNHNYANINVNCNDKANHDTDSSFRYPIWINPLRDALLSTPNSIIGEIGLDGFHFVHNVDNNTKELSSSISNQLIAFRYQMILGYQLHRPVSIHCVQCYGTLLSILNELTSTENKYGLPPKLYFHAFGGKIGLVDQIISIIQQYNQKQDQKYNKIMKMIKKKQLHHNEQQHQQQLNDDELQKRPDPIEVYFGFAPEVNYKSDKTALVMKHIGIHRIVLETDLLEYNNVPTELMKGIEYISKVFTDMSIQDIINITTENSYRLYNIKNNNNIPSSLSSAVT